MMMRNLVLLDTTTGLIHDYPRSDDEPVDQLDSRYVVLRVVREPRPEPGPHQQISETRSIDLEAKEWRWGWSITDAPPEVPAADWRTFKRALLEHPAINALLTGGVASAPAAALSLPATLLAAADGGDASDFRAAWLKLRRLGLVSAELLQEVRALGLALHLPEEFVASLGGSSRPAPEFVGQEWIDSAGDLWIVVQARGDDGQFLADDPETPERESLSWEKAS
jgi:hypothetical protein